MQAYNHSQSLPLLSHSWHLTMVDNLPSIFFGGHGILCKNELSKQQVAYTDISLATAQQRRHAKRVLGRPVHDFVPTFVTQRNPMMFCRRMEHARLVWLKIDLTKMDPKQCVTSRYNVAANCERFAPGVCAAIIDWPVIQATYWKDFQNGSVARGAEVLVHNRIPLKAIVAAEVANPNLLAQLETDYGLATHMNPDAFFYQTYQRAYA
ncbi:DUF4433 domain-containing protein [Alkalimonas sp. MEB108]|uniref:DUF4433 domain-containing protein n=1 Tax=Alkalimonas cellulosilytica TaxID=3058395 RepID=A0ABU7J956_9GAMM|nr:DUF4433 domain-containing protein [Alkalimonas sp. MEB108]MEE2003036.1 DUF4433 domain-containing protein [Alkalimonas sp. MEB108]